MNFRPVDVPSLRSDIVEMLQSNHHREQYRQTPYRHPVFSAHQVFQSEARLFAQATLFLATAEMTDLARQAANSLPDFDYAAEDLPDKKGLIFFDTALAVVPHGEPKVDYSIYGYFWAEIGGRGILCQPLTRRDVMLNSLAAAGVITHRDAEYSSRMMPSVIPMMHRSSFLPYGAVDGDAESRVLRHALRGLRATWLLMQQPMVTADEDRLDKATRRRFTRTGQEPPTVRVINLRRVSSSTSTDSEGSREYHHQWIVRGHWRQQWYPAREVHRPVWIAAHVKGPEGRPMIGGEKVYVAKADPPGIGGPED